MRAARTSNARRERRSAAGQRGDRTGRAALTVELLVAALDAALAEIAAEAFLIGSDGAVLHAYPAGRAGIASVGQAAWSPLATAERPLRRCALGTGGGESGKLGYLVFAPRASSERATAAAARRWSLTRRQTEVLARMIAGDFNKEIACALTCSRRAVEHHITAILRKTGTHSRTELLGRIVTDVTSTKDTVTDIRR